MSDAICHCGHSVAAHEHYRRGSDCAICGAESCRRFRRDRAAKPLAPNESTPLPEAVPSSSLPSNSVPLNSVKPVPTLAVPLADPAETNDAPARRRRVG